MTTTPPAAPPAMAPTLEWLEEPAEEGEEEDGPGGEDGAATVEKGLAAWLTLETQVPDCKLKQNIF